MLFLFAEIQNAFLLSVCSVPWRIFKAVEMVPIQWKLASKRMMNKIIERQVNKCREAFFSANVFEFMGVMVDGNLGDSEVSDTAAVSKITN